MNQWKSFTIRTGKGAVAIRAMIEFLHHKGGTSPLRDFQEHVMKTITEHDETISLQYVKNLTKEIENERLVKKSNKGRSWSINLLDRGEAFFEHFAELEWGTSLAESALPAEILQEREKATSKLLSSVNVLEPWEAMDPIFRSKMWQLQKGGIINLLAFNPQRMKAVESVKIPGAWIIRPLKESE